MSCLLTFDAKNRKLFARNLLFLSLMITWDSQLMTTEAQSTKISKEDTQNITSKKRKKGPLRFLDSEEVTIHYLIECLRLTLSLVPKRVIPWWDLPKIKSQPKTNNNLPKALTNNKYIIVFTVIPFIVATFTKVHNLTWTKKGTIHSTTGKTRLTP